VASTSRDLLLELYSAAVDGADPGPLTASAVEAVRLDRDRRILVLAFGKAATAMATATATTLLRSLHSIVGGVVVSQDGATSPYPTMLAMTGDHPIPGRQSFAAAAKIGDIVGGRRASDVAIVLVSGGASSLIAAPLRGQSEADLMRLHELLLDSGLDIAGMNTVRKRFSRWGGGRLALALAPAATYCLAVSDVIGDDLSTIGSGPCVPDPSTIGDVIATLQRGGLYDRISQTQRDYLTSVMRGISPDTPKRTHPAFAHVTAQVVGTNRAAVIGASTRATQRGLTVDVMSDPIQGEAATAGAKIANVMVQDRASGSTPRCTIWGGETTVALLSGSRAAGGGGRCQELALAAARVLHEAGEAAAGISILAAGTDGRDGTTDAAGACVDAGTWTAIQGNGRDPAAALSRHESNGALRAAGALIPRRATGTNVMDVVIGLVH